MGVSITGWMNNPKLFNAELLEEGAQAVKDGIYGEGLDLIGDEYINQKGETIDEIFEKITLDYTLFQGYALNVIWNKEGTQISEMYHLPFANVRSGKKNEEDEVEEYYYSSDWSNLRKYKEMPYRAFDVTDNKAGSEIVKLADVVQLW